MTTKRKSLSEKELPEIIDLYKKRGWPVSMVSEKFGVSDYKVRKFLKENEIELNKKSYQTIIFESFFTNNSVNISKKDFLRENKICQRLFQMVPDIRFWVFFDFSKYSDAADSLLYFTTEEWESYFNEQYRVFSTNIEESSRILELAFGANYKEKLNKKYGKQLLAASKLFDLISDLSFWENFKFDKNVYSLYYYLADGIKEDVLSKYKLSKINLNKKVSEKISDVKIGEDLSFSNRRKGNAFDFLREQENNG